MKQAAIIVQGNILKPVNSIFILVCLLLLVVYFMIQPGLVSIEQAQGLVDGHDSKFIAYLVSFLIMLLCALTPLPAEIIALSNTLIFSPVEAFLLTWLSAIISANVGYELGRLNCYDPCKSSSKGKICQWLSKYGYTGLAILRLVPIVPFFAINICSGIFKLNRMKFSVITAVTIIPAVALLTFFPHLFL